MIDLKSYFHNKYQGGESFIENVIIPIFGEDKYEDRYEEDILENNPELTSMAQCTGVAQILRLGTINIPMNPTDVFDITVNDHVQMKRNRVAVQQLIRHIMSTYSSAFMIFHYDDDDKWDWRFTFCSKQGNNQESTDSKRYTFLLGPNQSCRTAAENFNVLASKNGNVELEDIVKAFDVEALSDEFFHKYKEHYNKFCDYIYKNRKDESKFGSFFKICEEKTIRDYVKKLLGRLIFLQFLQKKGWLGGTSCEWNDGDRDFLQNLFKNATEEQKSDFLDMVLEPLFQNAIDTNRTTTNQDYDTKVSGYRNVKIPYLNGGLFGKDVGIDDAKSVFPASYFEELFTFFYQYNFTIDENDPNDAEVGIDPEMLGRIFENLLEDNKDKGAYYTPKSIVKYMCKESLIAYLQTDTNDDAIKEAIKDFVLTYNSANIPAELVPKIDKKLLDVKICDPAIGSGAFPMGLLKELFACRAALEQDFEHYSPAEVKKEIIQNNIYGVDIEKGAVDIARLRFWLTIILDESDPKALPNLDFKIMQGNSLLESYHGIDLSNIAVGNKKASEKLTVNARTLQSNLFFISEDEVIRKIQQNIRRYYSTDDHNARKILLANIENEVRQYLLFKTKEHAELHNEIDYLPLFNDKMFLWHTFFADVFEKGGFDIIIANPPYIKEMDNKKVFNDLKGSSMWDQYHVGKMDYWFFFLHKAIENTANEGIISFITSRYWINSAGAKCLIEHISRNLKFVSILDIGSLRVFDNVVGHHMCSLYRKTGKIITCKYRKVEESINNIELGVFSNETLLDNSYIITPNYEITFEQRKQYTNTIPLGEIHLVSQGLVEASDRISSKMFKRNPNPLYRVGQGIFVLSDEEKDKLTLSDEENLCIKKYACDGVVYRYGLRIEKCSNLIYSDEEIRNKIKSDQNYLQIKKHLDFMSEYITSAFKPYGLHRSRKKEYFESNKIIGPSMFKKPSYTYDDNCIYVGMSYNIIKDCDENYSLKYTLGIINSNFGKYWFYTNAKHRGIGVDVGVDKLREFPVKKVPLENQVPIIELVDKILRIKKQDPQMDTSGFEAEIDRLVYDLYNLTPEEIAIIECKNNE